MRALLSMLRGEAVAAEEGRVRIAPGDKVIVYSMCGEALPALKRKYPGAPVLLNVTPTFTPRVASYRDRGLVGNWDFNVSMSVNDSGVPTYTNTLDLRAQFGFALSVQTLPGGANATLVGNVTTLNLTASVPRSVGCDSATYGEPPLL